MNLQELATTWLSAWNAHDLEAIMSLYADDIVFNSPFVKKHGINDSGDIQGKKELRSYFQGALTANPHLRFDIQHIFYGSRSLVLFYIRMNTRAAAEFLELDGSGKIKLSRSHYVVTNDIAG